MYNKGVTLSFNRLVKPLDSIFTNSIHVLFPYLAIYYIIPVSYMEVCYGRY